MYKSKKNAQNLRGVTLIFLCLSEISHTCLLRTNGVSILVRVFSTLGRSRLNYLIVVCICSKWGYKVLPSRFELSAHQRSSSELVCIA
ncbi:hypothetical protein BKA66DRAFT_469304 [Pyrenochaeta sp. MPI-SDFR-AT-0127]|nr:hypothetical protein BKA66DRAFT_469304 [Pyrenochaeta sp. MPI-SDFR-AT-0127]